MGFISGVVMNNKNFYPSIFALCLMGLLCVFTSPTEAATFNCSAEPRCTLSQAATGCLVSTGGGYAASKTSSTDISGTAVSPVTGTVALNCASEPGFNTVPFDCTGKTYSCICTSGCPATTGAPAPPAPAPAPAAPPPPPPPAAPPTTVATTLATTTIATTVATTAAPPPAPPPPPPPTSSSPLPVSASGSGSGTSTLFPASSECSLPQGYVALNSKGLCPGGTTKIRHYCTGGGYVCLPASKDGKMGGKGRPALRNDAFFSLPPSYQTNQ